MEKIRLANASTKKPRLHVCKFRRLLLPIILAVHWANLCGFSSPKFSLQQCRLTVFVSIALGFPCFPTSACTAPPGEEEGLTSREANGAVDLIRWGLAAGGDLRIQLVFLAVGIQERAGALRIRREWIASCRNLIKRLIQICNDVFHVFSAHRDSHQTVRDAKLFSLFLRNACVGHGGGMRNQRLNPTQAFCQRT